MDLMHQQNQQPPLARRSSYQAQQDSSSSHHATRGGEHESTAGREGDERPLVKSTDMPDVLQAAAIAATARARAQANEEGAKKDLHNLMARYIKKEFDANYGGCWHCVVGRNFGSLVTHTSRTFIYFYTDGVAVLLFKSGSQAL